MNDMKYMSSKNWQIDALALANKEHYKDSYTCPNYTSLDKCLEALHILENELLVQLVRLLQISHP